MLGFWPSDAVLVTVQASLVMGPRPRPPAAVLRLRAGAWAWALPVSLGATIAVLAAAPDLGIVYAWLAVVGVPLGALVALQPAAITLRSIVVSTTVVGLLLAIAWIDHDRLLGEGAAVALTALSACSVASYVSHLTPVRLLEIGIVAMAALDAVLVFGNLLEGPNNTLNAATPGASLPHLQVALFGSALVGYGDLFIAAVLGNVIAMKRANGMPDCVRRSRRGVAVLVLGCSAAFDLLFLAVSTLPATVPVAAALLIAEGWTRSGSRQSSSPGASARR